MAPSFLNLPVYECVGPSYFFESMFVFFWAICIMQFGVISNTTMRSAIVSVFRILGYVHILYSYAAMNVRSLANCFATTANTIRYGLSIKIRVLLFMSAQSNQSRQIYDLLFLDFTITMPCMLFR